jgi:DNA-binding response OmpR family regulator
MPHLLLHSEGGMSQTAIILRNAGYIVTKIVDDDSALRLATSPHVDGVIVELPVFRAVSFARRLLEISHGDVAILAISPTPEPIRRLADVNALSVGAIEDDLVSTVDILIATRERCGSAFQNSRDALPAGA